MKIPSFILQKTNISTEKMWHFYVSAALWVAAYTLFAYSIIIFLNDRLQSEIWVGVFLATGSAIAILLDIPFGYLQKVFPTRFLLCVATVGLMVTVGIFLFAYQQILFVFLAAILYGVSHDLYDVTMLSYIFNNTIPAQYGENISQRSVAEALGILVGLIFSGLLLYFGTFTAQISLEIILLATLIIILLIFDRDSRGKKAAAKKESMQDAVTHHIQELASDTVKGLKSTAIKVINVTESGLDAMKNKLDSGHIKLKPLKPGKEPMMGKIWGELKKDFSGLGSIFTGKKFNIPLFWSMTILLLFSFWDTFVITFEPLFLAKFLENSDYPRFITGGVIMTLFILPLFALLIPFSKLADKYGRQKFIILGLCISGVSLFFFGQTQSLWVMILLGMTNSVGYAAAMPPAQALFAEKYNEHVAVSEERKEIDTNSSAAPLKMIINLGNVIGQAVGGALIWILSFNAFFIIFGIALFMVFLTSLAMYPFLKKPPYILDTEGKLVMS